jgi:hypothetical protein
LVFFLLVTLNYSVAIEVKFFCEVSEKKCFDQFVGQVPCAPDTRINQEHVAFDLKNYKLTRLSGHTQMGKT